MANERCISKGYAAYPYDVTLLLHHGHGIWFNLDMALENRLAR